VFVSTLEDWLSLPSDDSKIRSEPGELPMTENPNETRQFATLAVHAGT
jgi:hypothetical protein